MLDSKTHTPKPIAGSGGPGNGKQASEAGCGLALADEAIRADKAVIDQVVANSGKLTFDNCLKPLMESEAVYTTLRKAAYQAF